MYNTNFEWLFLMMTKLPKPISLKTIQQPLNFNYYFYFACSFSFYGEHKIIENNIK